MFTGLIEDVGEIVERTPLGSGVRLGVRTSLGEALNPGDSLALNGVCLTVTQATSRQVDLEVGPETVRVTTLRTLPERSAVNLERPLRADGRFGGHFVQGHVDGVGWVKAFRADAEFHWLSVVCPTELLPYIVTKGSIAVDGISLTVAHLSQDAVDIQIVPFTLEHTHLKAIENGARVNLECDLLGKYVVNALRMSKANPPAGEPEHLTARGPA
jgi:riboflavin synthase